jgi:predicted enzyme related to lactoylglutathione lyase
MAGTICWHELITDDVDAATGFYTELLGVELEKADMGDFEYPMLRKDGRTHAGFVAKPDEAQAPSHWYPYIGVDDVDAAAEKAKGLGAQVYMGPADVDENLRFAVLGGAQQESFGVMRWNQEPPTGLFAWDELYAADVGAASSFYGAIAGWTTGPFKDDYQVFTSGDTMVAGLMPKPKEMPVSAWGLYFAVDDTDAATAKAQELGATVMMEPTTMENVGRFSILADPTGAGFGLHRSAS